MTLIKHFPSLQILIILFGALFTVITFRYILIARFTAIISISASFLLSLYGLSTINNKQISYVFGNWPVSIGIEYRLDYLNQPIIIYINFVLLFFLVFCHKLTKETILKFIDDKRQSLFYAILLFAHVGYLGMISTNDLFNLYVFIEISSLSSYVLMAQGNNPRASIGAFDYLMLGTIGATLILIGIGFLLSYTGNLNMSDIEARLYSHYDSKIVMTGISFFLMGSLLKIACFPMHFWMMRAYCSTAPVILIYLASISSIVSVYIILRFIHFILDYQAIIQGLITFIRPIALSTIILCSYFAFKAKNVKLIVIYSSITQIGYMLLLLVVKSGESLLLSLLLADSLNKIALFLIIAYSESYSYHVSNNQFSHPQLSNPEFTLESYDRSSNKFDLTVEYNHNVFKLNNYQSNMLWRVLVMLSLICSSGLPISSMFIIKLNMLDLLMKQNLWIDFLAILISFAVGLLYHYKIAKILFWRHNAINYTTLISSPNYYGLIFIILLQFLLLISLNQLQTLFNSIVMRF